MSCVYKIKYSFTGAKCIRYHSELVIMFIVDGFVASYQLLMCMQLSIIHVAIFAIYMDALNMSMYTSKHMLLLWLTVIIDGMSFSNSVLIYMHVHSWFDLLTLGMCI